MSDAPTKQKPQTVRSPDKKGVGTKGGVSGNSLGNSNREASKAPTTFELAALSTILSLAPDLGLTPVRMVKKAMAFWRAAEGYTIAPQQMEELLNGVFTMESDEWEKRIETYCGDDDHLKSILNQRVYDLEEDVLPKLFPPRYTKKRRRAKLEELLQAAYEHGLDLIALRENLVSKYEFSDSLKNRRLLTSMGEKPKWEKLTLEGLKGKRLDAWAVRSLVEARCKKRRWR